ncbi:MAG: hypothetical protein QM724_09390 [Flavobacteriales bacterium]
MRLVLSLLLASVVAVACAQDEAPTGTLSFSSVIGLDLSRAQIFDAALDAWTYTFGQEPGARLDHQDRATGVAEGQARINFRSKQLTAREESMGPISYQVVIHADNGRCSLLVLRLVHTGDHNALHGGLDIGPIRTGDVSDLWVPGYSRKLVQGLHTEIRGLASERIEKLMRAFEARMRKAGTP